MTRYVLVLAALLALAPAAPAATAKLLADSTLTDAWRLENGLEVRVRDVPGARSVAISLAYRAGSFLETPARPDLATVLAQLQFTAPAGDVPERTLAEMPSIRPQGWAVTTNPHVSVLTEVVPAERFAGLLREVALRARGVQLDDSTLAHTVAHVRRTLGERRFGSLEPALYERVRDLALGQSEAQVLERVKGTALARLTRASADTLLQRYYVASNASLVLVGDFTGVDVRGLVAREFGAMPAGRPQPDPPAEPLAGQARMSVLNGIGGPIAAMGILAPALEDSLHPAFFLNALSLGGWWNKNHAGAGSGLGSHFQYSLLDEPELLRFEFELAETPTELPPLFQEWNESMSEYAGLAMDPSIREMFRASLDWMLGGPLGRLQRAQARETPSLLANLASTTATRAIWKGDAFWAAYRQRFLNARFGPTTFMEHLRAPQNQVLLVLRPRP